MLSKFEQVKDNITMNVEEIGINVGNLTRLRIGIIGEPL